MAAVGAPSETGFTRSDCPFFPGMTAVAPLFLRAQEQVHACPMVFDPNRGSYQPIGTHRAIEDPTPSIHFKIVATPTPNRTPIVPVVPDPLIPDLEHPILPAPGPPSIPAPPSRG